MQLQCQQGGKDSRANNKMDEVFRRKKKLNEQTKFHTRSSH